MSIVRYTVDTSKNQPFYTEGKNIMEENKNTPAETPVAENAAAEQAPKAKLTGDNRTFLVSLLTSVIVVIAYHMTMELIKFFNEDEFCAVKYQQVQLQQAPAMGHHPGGPRPMMKKKWQFRHFKDCKYFNEADCDQKPMKDCKCMDRYKEMRAKRRAEFQKKRGGFPGAPHHGGHHAPAAPQAPAAPVAGK